MDKIDILNEYGEYTGEAIDRDEAHQKGLWHKAVVVFIISEDNQNVLLQQRSATKKLWPNLWDITAGGHVLTGELGYDAVIRETKEELGIDVNKEELEFIGATTSKVVKGDIVDYHYNEYFIAHKNVDIANIVLQKEEVQNIKWFNKNDIIKMVNNNYENITDKIGVWNYLLKYFALKK